MQLSGPTEKLALGTLESRQMYQRQESPTADYLIFNSIAKNGSSVAVKLRLIQVDFMVLITTHTHFETA